MGTALACTFAAVLIRQFGLRGFGAISPGIYHLGNAVRILVPILATVLAGWEAGVVSLVTGFLVGPLVADVLVYPVLRKGSETSFGDFRSIEPWKAELRNRALEDAMRSGNMMAYIEKSSAEGEVRDAQTRALAQRPAVATVLARYAKDAEDLVRISHDMTRAGLGYRIPRKIVSTPRLLDEFYMREAEGVALQESLSLYIHRFGWIT